MRHFLPLLLVLSACEGPMGPAGPQGEEGPKGEQGPPGLMGSTSAAFLDFSGPDEWVNCFLTDCAHQGVGKNVGGGCASNVRGVIVYYDANNSQLGTAWEWGLPASTVVRPDETFVFRTDRVPNTTISAARKFVTLASWQNVTAC